MNTETNTTAIDQELRVKERLALILITLMTILPLVPYALEGLAG
jgi:hypothetical protein